MIQVQCVGGECNGLMVRVEPQPTYYEVVDPRDANRKRAPQFGGVGTGDRIRWRGRFLKRCKYLGVCKNLCANGKHE